MADSKGRPIIRPREVEAERILKRREWLLGLAEDPDKEEKKEKKDKEKEKKDKEKDIKKEKERRKSRSPERDRKSDRDRDDRKSSRKHRESSRERTKERKRSSSRDRKKRRSRERDDRSRRRRSHSRSRRRSRSSSSEDLGGYVPRQPHKELSRSARHAVSRSLEREAKPESPAAPPAPAVDAAALAAQQMAQAQAWILQQQAAQQAAAMGSKKQREVYVGNLAPGLVSSEMLKTLFDSAIRAAYPNAAPGLPPVVAINMAADSKYCFVEFRSEEMATAAIQLNKLDLCGQPLNIARPQGYIDPAFAPPLGGMAATGAAMSMGAGLLPGGGAAAATAAPDQVLVLDHMVGGQEELADEIELVEIKEDLAAECAKHGAVVGVRIPTAAGSPDRGKAFVYFEAKESAANAFRAINGRHFDGRVVIASYTSSAHYDNLSS